ncbi:NADH:flavin oxidoreductase/NADH oxidase [Herbiconiux sp.]|uniref:NADH:flavin oxidoreductase/NADH oxidase n=1 Tax=Herbiconiux sp. TaxID=1871186 RepID=UPI0025BC7487|nr:NADH:flavin oxidoreductase/NADH oxidase [Herbiconiux sp.]
MPDSALFAPLTLRSVTTRNRIWVAPMCQYSVERRDGMPGDWHFAHLASFAIGGAGLILTEATAVSPEGRISPEDLGIWNDSQRDAFTRITAFVRAQGAIPGIQLAHAGRKASTYRTWSPAQGTVPVEEGGWQTVGPSALAFTGYAVPIALTVEQIAGVVDDFRVAARRAVEAGFEVIEIHGAHGYLVHQFLSPASNDRTDEYGGSLENRARLLLEIVRAIRAEVGEGVPLFVRLSATDWLDEPGEGEDAIDERGEAATAPPWNQEQTALVAAWAQDAGADLFDISTGGNVLGVRIPVGPLYQVPFAEYVKQNADAPVGAVGLITTPQEAEEIVASGRADVVLLARELLRDPHFALRAATELGVDIDYWPAPYLRARPRH